MSKYEKDKFWEVTGETCKQAKKVRKEINRIWTEYRAKQNSSKAAAK